MAFRELCAVAAVAMMPPIGVIDFYGLHRVTQKEVRAAIAVHEGDNVPSDKEATVRRIEKIAGVEDDSTQGHSLISDPTARAIQLRFVTLAARHLDRIRDVLRHSADDGQRALAAQVIAYAPDKRKIVSDLVDAATDPSPEVRNLS